VGRVGRATECILIDYSPAERWEVIDAWLIGEARRSVDVAAYTFID
jgi:hypothetical protein